MSTRPTRRKPRSHTRFKSILKDPNACIVQTEAGPWKIHRNLFPQLLGLECFEKLTDRVARIKRGFLVLIDEHGFFASRLDMEPVTPSIFTNSAVVERHYLYDTEGRSVSLLERQREAALQYGIVVMFTRA